MCMREQAQECANKRKSGHEMSMCDAAGSASTAATGASDAGSSTSSSGGSGSGQ